MSNGKNIVVFYNNIPSGIAGAFLFSKKYPESVIISVRGKIEKFPIVQNKEIFFLFLPSEIILKNLEKKAKKITILEHMEHILNKKSRGKIEFITDEKKSVCQISWDYLFPELAQKYSWFLQDISDTEYWRNSDNSRYSVYGMCEEGFFESIFKFSCLESTDRDTLISKGKIILENNEKLIKKMISGAILCDCIDNNDQSEQPSSFLVKIIEGGDAIALVRNDFLLDEIAEKILTNPDNNSIIFIAVYKYDIIGNFWHIFLRARPNLGRTDLGRADLSFGCSLNMSKIAQLFDKNGWGHQKFAEIKLYGAESLRRIFQPVI